MRIGVIARADARGIGYQTRQFRENMPVAATLAIVPVGSEWTQDLSPFSGADDLVVEWDPHNPDFDENTAGLIRYWLSGLDVLFAVENLYDWRIIPWAHAAGCRVVVQGNPEFYLHELPEWKRPHPDEWWWPTPWLVEEWQLPGIVMPVPTPSDSPGLIGRPADDPGPLRVSFVIGHTAHRDRAGALQVVAALRHLPGGIRVDVHCQDADLPVPVYTDGLPLKCEVVTHAGGFDDRWDLYRDAHVLLAPRRYGGLSLPTIEALSCGLAVAMPDGSPNRAMWPIVSMAADDAPPITTQAGRVPHLCVSPEEIARVLIELNADRAALAHRQELGRAWAQANSWDTWRPIYMENLARVAGSERLYR